VAKLFNLVQPDTAIFGQKDFQQWVLVKRMCADLDFRCEVIVVPTVREHDGLAMSSRNVYLSADDRARALLLSRGLLAARERYAAGERSPAALIEAARAVLTQDAKVHVQYVELSDPRTLVTPDTAQDDSVLSLAAKLGTTRLIDNMAMGS
jgi:pantoate--beta-alanine ligase